ncbi:MAG: IS630 family transposase [Opitutales bacterium]|nr:IS630 family transposase [Opitutales bacterium]
MEAAKLFDQGKTRAEVSQALGVSWISANNWYKAWQQDGVAALSPKGKPGPPAKFSDEEAQGIVEELKKGSMAHGYKNEIWTLRRIGSLIREKTGKKTSPSEVWRLLRRIGWSVQKPERKARERDEEKIKKWKTEQWPRLRQKADSENRTIVFIDECGFSQKSTAKKTWAQRGETPVVQMSFNWDKLSVIGGISLKSIYFQMHEESIKSAQVVGFLKHLQKYIKGNLLVIWDGLPAHRSREVKEYLKQTQGRVWVERLPAYAPELNPIEYLWGHVKGNDLANFSPKDMMELSNEARKAISKRRGKTKLIRAFWIQTELDLEGMN